MAQYIEIDLYDTNDDLLSTGQVDLDWWVPNAVQAIAYAQQKGVVVDLPGGPVRSEVDMTIGDTGTWDNWISTQFAGAKGAAATNAASDNTVLAGVLAGVTLALGLTAWAGART